MLALPRVRGPIRLAATLSTEAILRPLFVVVTTLVTVFDDPVATLVSEGPSPHPDGR